MNKIIVDTNLLVRVLVNDDTTQTSLVISILQKVDAGEITIFVPDIVIIETCWVLKSVYKFTHTTISEALLILLNSRGVEVETEFLIEALHMYQIINVDFIDIYLSLKTKSLDMPILTWNKRDFKKLNCEFYTPEELVNQ